MKRSSLRGFGIACVLIGIIYSGVDKFFPKTESVPDETVAQYEEKIAQLEAELKDAKEQLSTFEQAPPPSDETEENEDSTIDSSTESISNEITSNDEAVDELVDEEEIIEGTLYIYSGLTPYHVAKKLEDMGIINNYIEMELFLAQPQYSRSIQKGQFKVNSSMTVEEIANLITGKTKSPN